MKQYTSPTIEVDTLNFSNICVDTISTINFDEVDDEDTDANL